ncbi:MAG: response regulator transcription factor [Chloroflexota bacterium]
MTTNHILVVDDDAAFRDTLLKALKNQGYRATGLADPDSLAATIVIQRPDVILLDMMFNTGTNGLDVCRNLRTWASIPVVILSVVDDETSKVAVLDAGADDYLTKPFGISELLARIRAVQRRVGQKVGAETPLLILGDLVVDFDDRQVKVHDKPIHLTRKEFTLLRYLADAQGRLVTYEQLLTTIWKDEKSFERSKVRALVMQLRNKLGEDLSNPTYILTEAGVGYRLNVEPVADIEKQI